MKILIVLITVVFGLVAQAQPDGAMVFLPQQSALQRAEPKLTIAATAKGQIADGVKSFGGLHLPKGIKITSPEASEQEVVVQVLKFDFAGLPADKYIETLDGKVGAEQMLKMIDKAGYRPATIVEILSVREKLSKIGLNITVYGSKAQLDGRKYYFNIDYHYGLGEDILPYINGKVGLFETDWKGERYALSFAVVKK